MPSSLVTLIDRAGGNDKQGGISSWTKASSVVNLSHPSAGIDQHFIKTSAALTTCDLYQVQSVSRKYGAFMVGSRVVSNGALHVMTRVDPLFFVLHHLEKQADAQTWQPLHQLDVPNTVQQALQEATQWNHLCKVKNLGDDDVVYKYCPDKTLGWLVKKQQAALAVLRQQVMESNKQKQSLSSGGAFSSNFHQLSDDTPVVSPTDKKDLTSAQEALILKESVQIVCDYLSAEWQDRLRKHLDIKEEDSPKKKRRRASWEGTAGQDDADQLLQFTMGSSSSAGDKEKTKKKEPTLTLGQKKLAKVNKKGMKSLSTFFSVKKKKTKGE